MISCASMSPREFKYGLLSLAETPYETHTARRLAALYIDASKCCKMDCTIMLRGDLVTERVMEQTND